ncbi:cysteine desulfurase [Atopobacter sp. AH10]|uniref:cysteine desulfurase family protein n=1 Tax=Atopobacter sp. AH10 TaxID=2315861 RepID=UPI000EF1977C|nr:cysteine desulfurase family protein [Atopobacter sp. AH10]RLK62961.1 cysteine desulfurase [Atopobacter sp. AH10]
MIYLDNSATTFPDEEALVTYTKVAREYVGNPSSLHALGEKSYHLLEAARLQIADLLNRKKDEIIFTSGGTESNNLAIRGTVEAKREFGRHVITSSIEHPSVLESLGQLKEEGIIDLTVLPVSSEGKISIKDLSAAIREDTILVTTMAVNNEVGAIQPLNDIAELLKAYPTIHWHVDGVQSLGAFSEIIPHERIDLMSFSAHKFHGPRGVGFLYKKHGRVISPQLTGGGQENGLRSTTENLAGICAMAKALRRHPNHGDCQPLQTLLKKTVASLDNAYWLSPEDGVPYINCFALENVKGEVLLHALEEKGIYISTTSACSSKALSGSHTLKEMAYPDQITRGAVRASFGDQTTLEEVEAFCQVLTQLAEHFAKVFA